MVKNPGMEGQSGPGTVVGVNVALSGTLKDQNDIVVYGMVDGEVISDRTVTVGESAQIKGPVRGETVTIAGVVRGEVDASDKLELMETGKLYGSITTKDLVIHSGAILIGNVTMGAEEAEAEPTPAEIKEESTNKVENETADETGSESEATKSEPTPTELAPDEE